MYINNKKILLIKIMNYFLIFSFLFEIAFSAFQNPIKNANFANGLSQWYSETWGQLELVEGTSGT